MIDYSIVIPCYCSTQSLPELTERVSEVMKACGKTFELILVDDDSPDGTWNTIEILSKNFPFVRGIRLMFNTGQFRATLCGLERARGNLVVTMDDDLQQAPEDIPLLLDKIESDQEIDCVMAAYAKKHHGPIRRLGSSLAHYLNTSLYGKPRHIRPSSFRVLRSEVASALCGHGTVNPIIGPLLYQTTRRIANVPVEHRPRKTGRSGYGFLALMRVFLNNYLNATTFPLRIVSGIGVFAAIVSVILGFWYLFSFLTLRIAVPGFVTTVLLILFFGGLTLFSIGLLGEYVKRIVVEVRRMQRYVIRTEVGHADTGVGRSEAREVGPQKEE